ncbi:MAG: efflux RND transporter periplasmic adaptor subunit [Legionellales bacterium]|nr:efflux RND transporter periplasmic adaptor subunit [Legionellales bacterium]
MELKVLHPILLLIKKKTFLIIALIIISLSLYYNFYHPPIESSPPDKKIVEVEAAKKGNIKQVATFIGTIRSSQHTVLSAREKGVIKFLSKPGKFVKKGELIANIENGDIERNFSILQEAEKIAKRRFERDNYLSKSGVSSKELADTKKAAFLDAQKRLTDEKIRLENLKIYAPFDGVLGYFKIKNDSQVNISDSIVNFYNPDKLIVEFDLPLSVAKQVSNTTVVLINNKKYNLTYVQKMLDEETHMCPGYVDIKCIDCIIGTTVDVSIILQEKTSVIIIPFEAIFIKDGKTYVYIAKENKAVLALIVLGIRNKELIEVKSGLIEGDKVILYGHNRLYPDASISIN